MAGRYFAKPTVCIHGHKHASKREATRCAELHIDLRQGKIDALVYEPTYILKCGETPIRMGNGCKAQYRPDFVYRENGQLVAEDVKPKNGWMSRDVPLRLALFRTCYPEIELRIVK